MVERCQALAKIGQQRPGARPNRPLWAELGPNHGSLSNASTTFRPATVANTQFCDRGICLKHRIPEAHTYLGTGAFGRSATPAACPSPPRDVPMAGSAPRELTSTQTAGIASLATPAASSRPTRRSPPASRARRAPFRKSPARALASVASPISPPRVSALPTSGPVGGEGRSVGWAANRNRPRPTPTLGRRS